jgi:hypothetical protein
MEKVAFIVYVFSLIVLFYTGYTYSPFNMNDDAWENSAIPVYFYTIVLTIIVHFLYTGKMLSLGNYPRVFWISGIVIAGTVLFILPRILTYVF